jgi:flagellar motor switch protein FliN/FliY
MADEQSDKSEAAQTETPPADGASDAAPTDGSADAAQMAEQALADAQQAVDQLDVDQDADGQDGQSTRNMDLPNFQQVLADVESSGIGLLHDVDLDVKIELGRTEMLVEDVLKLSEGSVVELDKLAGDPVDVFVNDRLVARGEVLVLNDNFCVRISEIVSEVPTDEPKFDEPESDEPPPT